MVKRLQPAEARVSFLGAGPRRAPGEVYLWRIFCACRKDWEALLGGGVGRGGEPRAECIMGQGKYITIKAYIFNLCKLQEARRGNKH